MTRTRRGVRDCQPGILPCMLMPLARAVSILGHPLLVLPLAALALMLTRRVAPSALLTTMAAMLTLAALLMLWSRRQVARRRWAHVDASAPGERRTLNRSALAVLALVCMAAWLAGATGLALGAGLSAGILLAALASAGLCHLSLHVAFACFAAGIAWTASPALGAAFALLAAGVAWSRLSLARHVPRDLVAGACAGSAAALAFVRWAAAGAPA